MTTKLLDDPLTGGLVVSEAAGAQFASLHRQFLGLQKAVAQLKCRNIFRWQSRCPSFLKVVTDGLEFEGELFKSLSAVAKRVTGSHWNGYKFFNLKKEGGSR